MIEAFKIVDLPNVLTNGGPGIASESLTLHAFMAWRALDLGGSAAIAYILLFVVTFFCVSLRRPSTRRGGAPADVTARRGPHARRLDEPTAARQGSSPTCCSASGPSSCCSRSIGWSITSFKLPIDVNDGPFYLPVLDFQPSLDAWQYLFGDHAGATRCGPISTR